MKKAIALALAGVMSVGLLAGCGSSGSSSSGAASESATGETSATTASDSGSGSGDLSISWWGGDSRHTAYQNALAAFTEETGIQVSTHYGAWSGWEDQTSAALYSDNAEDVMQVNVNATFMLTQALLPLLLKSDAGSLVFTSSSVGRQGRANWGAYAASKFATEGMMQVLADEYQQRLRVNCINPGGTRTAMRASAFPTEDPQKLKTPADIMPLYLWLMGDDSRRKTGMTFDAQPGRKPGISQ